ncbi:MAG: histidinol dehydrogenase [Pseudomonadota bacterium]
MAVDYLKKAPRTPATGEEETRARVLEMLKEIEMGGEDVARRFGQELDNYTGEIVVGPGEIEAAAAAVPQQLKDDIQFARDRVRRFAERQKDSLQPFEEEIAPGVILGQRLVPIETAGCYVPGGRYAHVASAIMSITTAKVAGVENVIACSAPNGDRGIHPAILYTMNACGADKMLALGGVQGIAAMAFGLFTGHAANIIVGPGNRFVAEAKRTLFGRVGIDLFAGPTEIAVISDGTADPDVVATDLVSQAEHGPDSPAWLITTDRAHAEAVAERMAGLIEALPEVQRNAATAAWRDYGEIAVCDTREEAVAVSDAYAPEHLEVITADDNWYVDRLKNYGSLFIGEETTVAFGDKCQGTNHILPTKGAGKYTGGLSVHKFIKVVTTQRMSKEAARDVAASSARISRLEGMEGHARSSDVRLAKYFPGENFNLTPEEV